MHILRGTPAFRRRGGSRRRGSGGGQGSRFPGGGHNNFRDGRARHRSRRGLLQPDPQIPLGILELLEIVLAHEAQQLLNMLDFGVREVSVRGRIGGLLAFHACSNLNEVPRNTGEQFVAVGVHGDVVFNANPSNAGHVNSRFDGNHVSRNQDVLLSARHAWIFVHFQAESVSGAMHKKRVKLVARQNSSGSGIDISTAGTRPRRSYRGRLRFLDRAIPSPYAHRGTSHEDSARNVATIVAEYSTQVQHDQFIFPQAPCGGPCVRVGGPLAKRHDGLKGRAGGPALPHLVFNLRGDLHLANAGLEQLEDAGDHLRSQDSSFAHLRDFLRLFARPQTFHQPAGGDPLNSLSRCGLEPAELGDGQLRGVESDAQATLRLRQLSHCGGQRTFLDHYANAGSFLLCLRREAPVGDQHRSAPSNEQGARLTAKTGEVKPVRRVHHQQPGKVAFTDLRAQGRSSLPKRVAHKQFEETAVSSNLTPNESFSVWRLSRDNSRGQEEQQFLRCDVDVVAPEQVANQRQAAQHRHVGNRDVLSGDNDSAHDDRATIVHQNFRFFGLGVQCRNALD